MQADGSIQRMKSQFRSAVAGAAAHGASAAIDKPAAAKITGNRSGPGGHVEIRIDGAIEPVKAQVGVQTGVEVDVDRAVQGLEAGWLRGILLVRDLHFAVQR